MRLLYISISDLRSLQIPPTIVDSHDLPPTVVDSHAAAAAEMAAAAAVNLGWRLSLNLRRRSLLYLVPY